MMHREDDRPTSPRAPAGPRRAGGRWYLPVATLLLLVAAFFRTWNLTTTPPGLHTEELVNAQISEMVRQGDISVIYDEVEPAREGLYYALLAASTTITGDGLMLWRLPSVWISMLALAITTLLMRRLFGRRVALMALGLMAVAFWPVWMGRAVQHVALMPLATAVVAFTLASAFNARRPTEASLWFTVGGIALGLSQYVHVTAWTLPVLFVVYVLYRTIVNRPEIRRHRADIWYTLALAAVIDLPLGLYLFRYPGAREPVPITQQPGLIAEIPGRLVSSLAGLVLQGDMLASHNLPGRPVFGPVVGALLLLGIGVALARWRRAPYGLALLWLIIGLLPTAFLPRKPDFEYMAVILPVVFVFPALGLRAVFQLTRERLRGRVQQAASSVIGLIVATLLAVNAGWTYRDYFLIWPSLDEVQTAYQAELGRLAHYLDTSTDPTPVSVCSIPVDERDEPFALTNARLLDILMHRSMAGIRIFDCTQSLVIANGGESQRIIFPRSHYYEHLPGPLLAWMRYAEDEGVPGVGPDVVMRLEVSNELADYAGAFITTALTAWPPEARVTGLAPLPLSFGYNVTFLGYEIRDEQVRAGDWVEVTSYWRMDGPPPPEVWQFMHMLGNPVVIVAQDDGLGVNTGTLQVRDVFLQHSMIQTPTGLAAGPYPLSLGLYFPQTGERLPAFVDGNAIADRVFLRSVTIER
ncbi:MAG TPA: glycosyltransferase family 39 protein [Aggregatilineales bacterium]|nr:glycosyltransferase family 39 protein [Aggregatilineales bacterium]